VTTRDTLEEALHREAEEVKERSPRAANQRRYLRQLAKHVDLSVLASEEMWR